MKKMKNAMFVIAGGLLMVTVATVSCSKSSPAPTAAVPTISSIPATDTVGKTITITGTGFSNATTVNFPGAPGTSIASISGTTTITVVVPSAATVGAGTVTVTTGTGTSAGSSVTIVAANTLFSIDGFTASSQVASANLAGYWPFDGSTAESNSGKGPALSGGTITYVSGKIGQAAHFNNAWLTYPTAATWASADNSVGSVGNNDTLKNGFTISMWLQVPDTDLLTNTFSLFSPNIPTYPLMGIWYRKHADSVIDFDGGAGTVDNNGPTIDYADFQAGGKYSFKDTASWAFIAMVYDTLSHSLFYYANNIKIATIPLPAPTNSEPLLMVAPNYATFGTVEAYQRTPGDNTSSNTVPSYISDGLTGNIDDVRLFNKTLTAQQLNDLYQLGNHGQ
jgi:hypothetical protein